MRLRYCSYDFLMMLDTLVRWALGVGVGAAFVFQLTCLINVRFSFSLISFEMNGIPTGWAWGSSGYRCSLNRKDTPFFVDWDWIMVWRDTDWTGIHMIGRQRRLFDYKFYFILCYAMLL